MDSSKGFFVVFEGIDGVGKTSIIKGVYEHLKDDFDIVLTKEPTKFFNKLNKLINDPESEIFQFWIDRLLNLNRNVKPALEEGKLVIQDRYFDSTYAYQDRSEMDSSFSVVNYCNLFLIPDITFVVECPIGQCLERLKKSRKSLSKYEKEDLSVWLQRSALYKKLRHIGPKREIFTVINEDGMLDFCISEVVHIIRTFWERKVDGLSRSEACDAA